MYCCSNQSYEDCVNAKMFFWLVGSITLNPIALSFSSSAWPALYPRAFWRLLRSRPPPPPGATSTPAPITCFPVPPALLAPSAHAWSNTFCYVIVLWICIFSLRFYFNYGNSLLYEQTCIPLVHTVEVKISCVVTTKNMSSDVHTSDWPNGA